jgi:RHS repeat-associated protein
VNRGVRCIHLGVSRGQTDRFLSHRHYLPARHRFGTHYAEESHYLQPLNLTIYSNRKARTGSFAVALPPRGGGVETTCPIVYPPSRLRFQNPRAKLTPYFRDGTTALDYAQQRYYSSTLGRFLSADPYRNSAGPADPGSWNRYAYTGNDPVNFNDSPGLFASPAGQPPPPQVYDFAGWVALIGIPPLGEGGVVTYLALSGSGGGPNSDPTSLARFWRNKISKNFTDCQALAGFAASLASTAGSMSEFVDGFGALVPAVLPAMLAGIEYSKQPVYIGNTGLASGYLPQYRDSSGPGTQNQDQSHHFAFYFELGAMVGTAESKDPSLGLTAGLTLMFGAQLGEILQGTPSNSGDVALGNAAMQLGYSVGTGALKPSQLSSTIVRTICNK